MKYIKEYSEYKELLKSNIDKSIKKGIIKTDKSSGELVDILTHKPEVGTFEYFIHSDFTSEFDKKNMPEYLDQIKKDYNVDISNALSLVDKLKRIDEIETKLEDLEIDYSYEERESNDEIKALELSLIDEYNSLLPYVDDFTTEINNIKLEVRKKLM